MRKRDIYNAERAQGKTYQEIADMFGVTRQTVHRCVNYISHERPGDRWPRLRLWMEQNGINNKELAKLVGVSSSTMSEWRRGIHEPSTTGKRKLLLVTGLSAEELFAENELQNGGNITKGNQYERKEVLCPFYNCEDPTKIMCEGIVIGGGLHIVFSTRQKKKIHQQTFCTSNYPACYIYTMLEQKYDENGDLILDGDWDPIHV